MPTTVYTLLCQTDRTGHVLAVFTDRAQAAEVARANAATHAERLRRQDEKTFKAPVADDVYQVHVEDLGSNLTVFIRHRFLDEAETYRWLVDSFELVPDREWGSTQPQGCAANPAGNDRYDRAGSGSFAGMPQ